MKHVNQLSNYVPVPVSYFQYFMFFFRYVTSFSKLFGTFDFFGSKKPLDEKAEFLCRLFSENNSKTRRLKKSSDNPLFVLADKRTIGIRWKTKLDSTRTIPNHYVGHNDYSYVSIIDNIKSLFKRPKYSNIYFSYNMNQKHKCTDNSFENYCCAKNAKICPLLDDPKTLLIDVFTDDYEVCSALKTKAVKHKVTGVYFRIRNLPAQYNSRLDHIHLIAVVKVQDLKQSNASFI